MNVVVSSGWLEFFSDSDNADFFAPAIEDIDQLVVPSISLYEVFKRIHQQSGEDQALQVVAQMQQGKVIDLTSALALRAAHLSVQAKLPLEDSIILATAHAHQAILWTQDAEFQGLEDVRYIEKIS